MKRIGAITPSSNVMVEQVTQHVAATLDGVSAHFARFSFHGSTDPFPDDYDWAGMMTAAELLGHARPDVICWNGTKGGVIGFARDRVLCERIEALTGVTATTSSLALDDLLRARRARRLAFVTPYRPDFAARVARTWEAEGYAVATALGADIGDNHAFAALPTGEIEAMVAQAARSEPDAIVLFCTNMAGAYVCASSEDATGLPVFDAVAAGIWSSLCFAGVDTAPLAGEWGSMFGHGAGPAPGDLPARASTHPIQ